MGRLTCFEYQKVWCRRSFRFAACMLLTLNIFFQWYTNLGNERTPELSSYRAFAADIRGMPEKEKDALVKSLKRTIDGVSFVDRILSMQSSGIGADFAAQEMAGNPGVFEAYYDLYESGNYLRYTGSLELESIFLQEMYEEEVQVATYRSYLHSIQEKKASLSGISIFAPQNQDSFASRNLQKSAEDYKALSSDGMQWAPSKTVVSTMENVWTDVLLVLLSFLFLGSLIMEEKQKGLLYITRSTKYGVGYSILAKLSALLIHCLASTALLYCSNYLYFGITSGWCDVTAKLQSLAPYRESSLSVSILGFMALSVATKALVLFGACAVLAVFCILSESIILPYLAGIAIWAVSWALYRFVPAASKISAAKYANLYGALRAENLYGTYLNLNLWEHPLSRVTLTWMLISMVILAGVALSIVFFVKGGKLQCKRVTRRFYLRFRPHASLFRHEGYKILISNHGLMILLVFCCLIGYDTFHHAYTPTTQEQYYQDMMLQLEGELTAEKVDLIESESARYQEAFAEIEKIDRRVASGAVDSNTGDAMKAPWYRVTAFYPEFQRVEQQWELVRSTGGRFVYDTGYLYLFGVLGESTLSGYLLLTIGILLAFSHVMSMEHQCGAWKLLCATAGGIRRVITRKIAVCCFTASLFSAFPFLCRLVHIARVFPMQGWLFPARSIPFYGDWPEFVSIAALLLLKMLLQITVGLALTLIVAGLSGWRKNHAQACFFGLLLLCAPIILAALGFGFAQRFSLYPLYACTL